MLIYEARLNLYSVRTFLTPVRVLAMAQTKASSEPLQIIRRHLPDIRDWQAQGKSARGIAKELGLAETSYRRALAAVEKEEPGEISPQHAVLRELQEIFPVLKAMARQWSEQQALTEIPDKYKTYGVTYSVRLNERLIEAVKEYAKRHRLSQSEVVTSALQQLLNPD
jgi:hypothetical protein